HDCYSVWARWPPSSSAPPPPLTLGQLWLTPAARLAALPPWAPAGCAAMVAPVPPLPPTTRLFVNTTSGELAICMVTAGEALVPAAVDPRILKFSRATGFTRSTLIAGAPPGGAEICEVNPAPACSEETQPPTSRAPAGVVWPLKANVAGRAYAPNIAKTLQLEGLQRESARAKVLHAVAGLAPQLSPRPRIRVFMPLPLPPRAKCLISLDFAPRACRPAGRAGRTGATRPTA